MRSRPSTPRRALATLATVASAPLTLVTVPLTGYLAVLTVAGLAESRRLRHLAATATAPATRFAVLVPAHDEGLGIGDCVASLLAADYPPELFAVHVVCDNCTDDTAAQARRAGAVAHERDAPDDRGKGAALNWLHDRLVDGETPFDAFVIVDADTRVDSGFLRAMDRAVRNGAKVAQGFYDVHEAGDSAAASLRAAALACRHHLRPLGRNRLGGSCGLYGNGMVFTADVLATRRWSGHLTEDLEMQADLLLDGELVRYVPEAQIRAEMPDELDASVTQHQRWEAGRVQVLKTALPRLARAVVRGAPASRGAALDSALDVTVPPLSVLVAAQVAAGAGAALAAVLAPTRGRRRHALVNALAAAALVGHVVAGLRSVGAPASTYRALVSAPRLIVWKVGLWLRVVGDDSAVEWTRTARNAAAERTDEAVAP